MDNTDLPNPAFSTDRAALVEQIVEQVTGATTCSSAPICRGMSNSVSVAHTSVGDLVVRTNVEGHLFNFQREAWCFSQLQLLGVLIPTVLGCGTLRGYAYSLARFIPESQPISSSAADPGSVWKVLGRYARCLNSLSILPSDQNNPSAAPHAWEEYLTQDVHLIVNIPIWKDNLSTDQLQAVQCHLLKCAQRSHALGVCQFDLGVDNAVIRGDDCSQIYLLDLEWLLLAPVPFYQLACILANNGAAAALPNNISFLGGYGLTDTESAAMAPELERFILYRLMRGTAWAYTRCPELAHGLRERAMPLLQKVLSRAACKLP
jgi:hypothetical protein